MRDRPQSVTTADPHAAPRPVSSSRLRTLLAWTGVVVWLGWSALVWWGGVRPVDPSHAVADVRAGRVVSYEFSDSMRSPTRGHTMTLPHPAADGAALVWVTTRGQTFVTAPDIFRHPGDLLQGGGSGPAPKAHALAATMRAHGAVATSRPSLVADRADRIGSAGLMTALLFVVVGPRPRRATRWCWFWLAWLPLGIGVVGWLLTEHLSPASSRSRAAGSGVPRPAGDGRGSGGLGFGVLVAGSMAVSAAVLGFRALLGAGLIPG